jgi:hypothetical protein
MMFFMVSPYLSYARFGLAFTRKNTQVRSSPGFNLTDGLPKQVSEIRFVGVVHSDEEGKVFRGPHFELGFGHCP